LKVRYESMVDWRLHRDILRCSPKIYGKERRDCVLVDSDEGVAIAQLILLLECENPTPSTSLIHLALVSYADPVFGAISAMERATGFRRFRRRPRAQAEIIPARSIIRGVLLVP
ncbi:hypothetical protein BDV93DRAFT_401084, partial [Ceratobasidium sp. AG-I]